jgi:hypothetical protein
MSRLKEFLGWNLSLSPAHHEPIGEEEMAKKDKDTKKDGETGSELLDAIVAERDAAISAGDYQDGAKIFMQGAGGGNPDVQVRAAPGVIDAGGTGSLSENVVARKAPKKFVPQGRPVDAVQAAEIGDINALGIAVQNFLPSTAEGQFFKQVCLKILHYLNEGEE